MSIEIEQVSYTYGAETAYEIHALSDVSLTIGAGEFVGIVGATGSGKSTLVQLLNGLLRPDVGHIRYRGEDICGENYSLRALRGKVGLVFQYPEYQLFETTVLRDVAFGPGNQGLSEEEARAKAKKALERVGLPQKYWEAPPFDLSGGMKRRAAIAGVLAMEPEVLILDEPTAGLDPAGKKELFSIICGLHASGMTVILVSHSMDDVADYADRVVVLDHGRILFDGTPKEVFSHAKELEEVSLAVPQAAYLMRDLRDAGFDVSDRVTTLEEAETEILKIFHLGHQ